MSKKSNTLALPVNPLTPKLNNGDSDCEPDTPNINKSVSFIDMSGNVTNRFSAYNEAESSTEEVEYESDNDDSSLLNRKTTSSSLGSKFSRKSTNSSLGSKLGRNATSSTISSSNSKLGRKSTGSSLGSRLNTIYRKSTSTIGSGLNNFKFRNSFSIGRNKTLKKLLDTKTVGFAGGVTLLINGILGPGLIPTPQIFSVSGLIIPALTFTFFAIFSTVCAQFIVEAMQTIPGNKHFQGTVEFSTLINFYFGKKMHILGQFILYMALQSANVSSIIYSAQTMDNFIINFFKRTYGIAANIPFFSNTTVDTFNTDSMFSYYSVDKMAEENSPFGDQFMLVTLGYIITFVCIFPVGFMKLQDNINMQVVSFLITVLIFTIWFVLFYFHGFIMENVPLLSFNCKEVVGVVMFNFAFVTTIPSWINIKKKEVSVQKSLWTSTITSVVIYIIIGYSAALTFKTEGTLNILSQLSSLNVYGRITTYIFSIAILMVSIPTFSIIVRNNLVQNKICGYKTATFFSHVLPWICVLPFQTGTFINEVINWSSLLFVSTANFIIPIIIYLKCLKFKSESKPRPYFTPRQREILKTIHWSSKTIQGFIDAYPVTKDDENDKLKKSNNTKNKINNNNNKNDNDNETNNKNKLKSSSENLNKSNNDSNNESDNEVPQIYLYPSKDNLKPPLYNENNNNSDNNTRNRNGNGNNDEDDSKIIITEENAKQFLPPPPAVTSSSGDIGNSYRASRFSILPTHPLFISNYYKGIPSWIPFKPKTFAKICLTLISIIIIGVIGLNVYEILNKHNLLIGFNNSETNALDTNDNLNNTNSDYYGNAYDDNYYTGGIEANDYNSNNDNDSKHKDDHDNDHDDDDHDNDDDYDNDHKNDRGLERNFEDYDNGDGWNYDDGDNDNGNFNNNDNNNGDDGDDGDDDDDDDDDNDDDDHRDY